MCDDVVRIRFRRLCYEKEKKEKKEKKKKKNNPPTIHKPNPFPSPQYNPKPRNERIDQPIWGKVIDGGFR